eukprot:1679915-Pyramimonas_sp.AAC.1
MGPTAESNGTDHRHHDITPEPSTTIRRIRRRTGHHTVVPVSWVHTYARRDHRPSPFEVDVTVHRATNLLNNFALGPQGLAWILLRALKVAPIMWSQL